MGTFSAAGDTVTYRAAGDTGTYRVAGDTGSNRIGPLEVWAALQKVCNYCISFILLNCKYLHLHYVPFDFTAVRRRNGVGRGIVIGIVHCLCK